MEKKSRRGLTVYRENPSVKQALDTMKTGVKRISNTSGTEMIIASKNTGEIVTGVDVGFHQRIKVDKTQFVKLYIQGVTAFTGLSKTGASVLEMVIAEAHKNAGRDSVYLSARIAEEIWGISRRSYMRGIKELLEKEILFEQIDENLYFINVNFMFNGDRLAFLRTYELIKDVKESKEENNKQPSLPFED